MFMIFKQLYFLHVTQNCATISHQQNLRFWRKLNADFVTFFLFFAYQNVLIEQTCKIFTANVFSCSLSTKTTWVKVHVGFFGCCSSHGRVFVFIVTCNVICYIHYEVDSLVNGPRCQAFSTLYSFYCKQKRKRTLHVTLSVCFLSLLIPLVHMLLTCDLYLDTLSGSGGKKPPNILIRSEQV